MGLDTTHGAWHGAYSAFYRWRMLRTFKEYDLEMEMVDELSKIEKPE